MRHRAPQHVAGCGDNLPHGIAGAIAEIVGRAAAIQYVERAQMCVREIGHVDVVAHTGSVGRGVIVAKHRERVDAAEGGVDRERIRCVSGSWSSPSRPAGSAPEALK